MKPVQTVTQIVSLGYLWSHEPKIAEETLVSSPPRPPPSERFHLATTIQIFGLIN